MNTPQIIEGKSPLQIGSFVSITKEQTFMGIKYQSAQCGHIESINGDKAVINWHHGVAPKQTVSISSIKKY